VQPVHQAIDLADLPWARPLATAYVRDYASLAPFFAGNPFESSAWMQTIARVQRAPRERATLSQILETQLARRQAPDAAMANARALASSTTVAMVTGQQAGLFGGPLYTLLKAVTTIQLARRISKEHGTRVVPVFWVEAEDHDWAEVRATRVLDRDSAVLDVELADVPGAGVMPVGALRLDERVADTLDDLERTLHPTAFTADLMAALRRRYRPGAGMAEAFAGWMDDLLGEYGLVSFESDDPAAKGLVADLFQEELRHSGRATALAREAGEALAAKGFPAQLEASDSSLALFYLDDHGRRPLRRHDGGFTAGSDTVSPAQLERDAGAHPERFSPNVILRPVVQDRLFPTICYVAGPNELAYLAQLGSVYRALAVEPPLFYPRVMATLLDAAAAKFLERSALPLAAFQSKDDVKLNELLERLLPADFEPSMAAARQSVVERTDAIRASVTKVDPTLAGVADSTRDRMHDALKTLHAKVVQAAKRKDETLRRQFHRTQSLTFPGGVPQERSLGIAFFVNRYGLGLGGLLVERLPVDPGKHYVLVI
jgi:bacillithiol synthase